MPDQAVKRARAALAEWDNSAGAARYLDRAVVLAEALRALIEFSTSVPAKPELPAVLLDADGDLWVDRDGSGVFGYISPYVVYITKTRDELTDEDERPFFAADWIED